MNPILVALMFCFLAPMSFGLGYIKGCKDEHNKLFNNFADCVMANQDKDGWIAMKCVLESYEINNRW